MCFCLGIQDVLDSATSARKKNFLLNHISMVVSGDTLAKSVVLLKICLYTNSKRHGTIRYSGKYLPIFLGFSFVVLACIVRKWGHSFYSLSNCDAGIYSGLMNWGILLNDLYTGSCIILNLFFTPKHLNSSENKTVLFSDEMTWELKQFPVRITFTSKAMSTI